MQVQVSNFHFCGSLPVERRLPRRQKSAGGSQRHNDKEHE